jgi:hypothetical protein
MKCLTKFLQCITIAAAFGPCSGNAFTVAEVRDTGDDIRLDDIRKNAARMFEGYSGFDASTEVSLDDQLPEREVNQPCRSVPEVLRSAQDTFPRYKLFQSFISRQYPRNAIAFRREISGGITGSKIDVIVFYFAVEKSNGLDCKFTLGAFARTVVLKLPIGNPEARKAAAFQQLKDDINAAFGEIVASFAKQRTGVLFRPTEQQQSLEESRLVLTALKKRATNDNFVTLAANGALAAIRQIVEEYDTARSDFQLLIVTIAKDDPAYLQRYNTGNCIAIPNEFPQPTIVCSAAFLAEIEGVVRNFSFNDIQDTPALRTFINKIGHDPIEAAKQFRLEPAKQSGRWSDSAITERLKMAFLFILGHEVGHLLSTDSSASFGEAAQTDSSNYRGAILRLCKQADTFKKHDLILDGADSIADPFSAARWFIDEYRQKDRFISIADDLFRAEEIADAFSTDISIRYLSRSAATGKPQNVDRTVFFVYDIEALSVYFWYKDLFSFIDNYCEGNDRALMTCLAFHDENFVAAANLFGKFHPNIFLRRTDLLWAVLAERTTFFNLPVDQRLLVLPRQATQNVSSKKREELDKIYNMIRLFFFTEELSDTPLKLAYFGCTLGWVREARGDGTVPMVAVAFFTFEQEVDRFAGLIEEAQRRLGVPNELTKRKRQP